MKLKHFAVFGGIFTVIICLLLFLFILTADDEENSTSHFDFSGLNLSEEVLKHQPTVEKYAKEYGVSDYVNYLLAICRWNLAVLARQTLCRQVNLLVCRLIPCLRRNPSNRGVNIFRNF